MIEFEAKGEIKGDVLTLYDENNTVRFQLNLRYYIDVMLDGKEVDGRDYPLDPPGSAG